MKVGHAFGENIITEKIKRHGNYDFFGKSYSIRGYILPLILAVTSVLIVGRLFFLQIVKGSYYRSISDTNRTRTIVINAPRGIFFDRNKIPLVFNVPGYREKPKDGKETKIIDNDEAIKLIAKGWSNLEIDSLRSYPFKDAFAHVLGYIGQISEEELKDFPNYKGGDLIGKTGIEKEYESVLSGTKGRELVEVDSLGKVVRKLGKTDPIPGKDIMLTVDSKIQKAAFEASSEIKKGAIIVSTPKGEILALISKPSFDPNLFTKPNKDVSQILGDSENQPLLNRAIGGVYPPGSTFKLITATAGLEEKKIDKNFKVEDTGILTIGAFSFANWYFAQYGKKEGSLNVIGAIKRSNDIFFYKLAEMVGVEKLSVMAEKFGLGKTLGIDLIGEEKGLVPSPLWKEKVIGDKWFLGDTYHYGIGQGYLLTTPLQVNYWTQVIANGGVGYRPHLLKNSKSEILNPKFLTEETVSLIREGMIESCSRGGVAWPLFEFKVKGKEIKIACKTGTAQHGGEETLPHAWITLFAPSEKPEIIVTVLSESSGEGSNIAAPIAKKIMEEWFSH